MRKRNSRDRPESSKSVLSRVLDVAEIVLTVLIFVFVVGVLSSLVARKIPKEELPEEASGIIEPSVPDEPDKPTGPIIEVTMPDDAPAGDTPWIDPDFEWE